MTASTTAGNWIVPPQCAVWLPAGVPHEMQIEGANNIALALFSFLSLAAYEAYRSRSRVDPECLEAFRYADETRCVISYERSFFRPVFD